MNHLSKVSALAFVALILISLVIAQAGPQSHPLNEDAALDLLDRTLKHDSVYKDRISMDCISYGTEEMTNAYFEFVLREIHNAKCGGDPVMSQLSTVTVFIAVPAKSSSTNQPKTNGSRISRRKISSRSIGC